MNKIQKKFLIRLNQNLMLKVKLNNDKTIYYAVNNNNNIKDFKSLCYNSNCKDNSNCNIIAVSFDNKYCFYLNEEPTDHIEPPLKRHWSTLNISQGTAGSF